MEVLSFLEKTVPFSNLPKAALLQTCAKLKSQKFPKDSFVFKKGEQSHQVLYIVHSGLAEVVVTAENQEISFSLRKPHEIFGETVFLTGHTYPASVKAVQELSCFLLDIETFEDLCVKYPSFAKFFNQILSERMRSLYQELILTQSIAGTGLESNPFRHRLSEVMISPVITCHTADSVQKIAHIMTHKQISSVAVLDEEGKLAGIITEKDLVAKCIAAEKPPATWPTVSQVMDANPVQLSPNAVYYQGLLTMIRNKCKHILLTEAKEIKGIVTIGDLIKFRSMGAFSIVEDIENQTDLEGLRRIRPQVDNVVKALVLEKANPLEIGEIVTEFNDRIIGKVIKLCEQELSKAGLGLPPVDYCWFTMDSSGRKEQLLKTEQYNGIIFDHVSAEKAEQVATYFLQLGDEIVNALEQVGFVKGSEEVLSNQANWCSSGSEWQEKVTAWLHDLKPTDISSLENFFDLRPVYGRISLANNLKEYVLNICRNSKEVLHYLALADLQQEVPISLFKKTITEKTKFHKKEINLKTEACLHVINCIRIFAVKEGIMSTSTLKRLEELVNKGAIPKEEAEFIEAAFQSLKMFRLKCKLEKTQAGQQADDWIDPNSLSKKQYAALKEAFLAASQLQDYTRTFFIRNKLDYHVKM